VRHPAPGVFAFFPIIAASALWAVSGLPQRVPRIAGRIATAVLAAVVAGGATAHVVSTFLPRDVTLESQRAAVAPLAAWVAENEVEWLAADPWGAAVAPIVLTGAHLGLADAPSMAEVPRLTGGTCATETLADSGYFRICAAP
jgi:hypothetical protein